jgi:1,2-phenylacetyl-CoA epoxidase catalytic subunit
VSRRAQAEWANRVVAEYTSAARTAQGLHLLLQCGLTDGLEQTAMRIVADELEHARLSHDCLLALGGADAAAPIDHSRLRVADDPAGPLATLLDLVVHDFCLGETFAVPLFLEMRQTARLPAARVALDRIVVDEAVHRAFGWSALDALLATDGTGVRARIATRLPTWLADFQHAYGDVDGPQPTADELAAGLLPASRYRALHAATLRDEIQPRLERRGLPFPLAA